MKEANIIQWGTITYLTEYYEYDKLTRGNVYVHYLLSDFVFIGMENI